MDYSQQIAVAVTKQEGKSGFYIEIQRVAWHDGILTIYADLGDPVHLVGVEACAIYHLVRIARSDVPGPIVDVQLEVTKIDITYGRPSKD